MRTLKTMVVGGANTVVRGGYLEHVQRRCRSNGGVIDLVEDLSVGNTTVGYGFYRLLEHANRLRDVELLIVEYARNDEFIYGGDLNALRLTSSQPPGQPILAHAPRDGVKPADEKLLAETSFLISGILYAAEALKVDFRNLTPGQV